MSHDCVEASVVVASQKMSRGSGSILSNDVGPSDQYSITA